jgi:uncharacterized protein (DUF488 family)
MRRSDTGLFGVGYEGQTLDTFVDSLVADGVTALVDVRLNALSRKRGFSKRSLGDALAEAGIAYEHRPELGNPKENREGFGASGASLEAARETYAARLADERAAAAIQDLMRAGSQERVALLCFEADDSRCHRQVILSAVESRRAIARGSKHRAR